MPLRRHAIVALVLATCLTGSSRYAVVPTGLADLPPALADQEFWRLVETLSEPEGYFRSDNLVSNEDTFAEVLPALASRAPAGGVYLGVGPDQNFNYILALRPRLSFIPDIRRGNLHVHLMYKALFELAPDRAEFLSRLFSRPRPPAIGASSTVDELFTAYRQVVPSIALYDETLAAVVDRLTAHHGFSLTEDDESGIDYALRAFYQSGPSLSYSRSGRGGFGRYPTYEDLQRARDGDGRHRAYLASEESYQAVRALQDQNLIVPVVGDFAGPRALRAIGVYTRQHRATISAFYTSNVEQYLFQNGRWDEFARNLATLPLTEASTLVRSCFNNCRSPYGSRSVMLLDSIPALVKDFNEGLVRSYRDVLSHSR